MKTTLRYLLLGLVAFLGFAVYMAPATLVRSIIGDSGPVVLAELQGRLWRGGASVLYQSYPVGQLEWSFDPGALLEGAVGFDWELIDPGHTASGQAHVGLRRMTLAATGTLYAASIDRTLEPYYIEAGGELNIARLYADFTHDLSSLAIEGELSWSGGDVRYRLSGRQHRATLPALFATIETTDGEPTLTARAEAIEAPLVRVRLDSEGWVNIGITKQFTKMVGQPWPGREPDHAVVLEVGEKLF